MKLFKTIILGTLLLLSSFSAKATDVTISAGTVQNFRATGLQPTRTGTLSVTNGSDSVTCTNCLENELIGQSGFRISIVGVDYTVDAVTSRSAFSLSTNYAASTNASAAYTLYPVVFIRLYASINFLPLGGTSIVQAGAVGSNNFYIQKAASVINNTIYLPEITVPATTDTAMAATRDARFSARFHRINGSEVQVYGGFNSFAIPPSPTTTTWGELLIFNTAQTQRPADERVYNVAEVNSLLDTIITATPEYILKADTAHRAENSGMYQDSTTVTNTLKTDMAGGIPTKTAAQIAALTPGNKGRRFYQTDGIPGIYEDFGSSVGIRRINPCVTGYEIGLVPNASGSAAANSTAYASFHTAAPSNGACLQLDEQEFFFNGALANTKPIQIIGTGGNFWNTGGSQKAGTTLTFPDGSSGITFTGATAAKGGRVANLNLKTLTGFAGQTTGYGIWTDATITVENVSISGFAIDGLFFAGTTASGQNPALSKVDTIHVFDVKRDGIHIDGGGETNLITLLNPNVTRAGRHGIYDAGTNNTIINAHVNDSAEVTASSYDYFLKGSSGVIHNAYSELGTGSDYIWFDTGAVGYTVLTGITGAPTISGVGAAVYDNHYIVERGFQRDLNLKDTTDAAGGHNYRLYSRNGAIWAGGAQFQDLTDNKVAWSYNPSTTTLYTPGANVRELSAQTVTPSQITSNQNNYNPSAGGVYRISSDSARDITGWTAAAIDGTTIEVRNVGSFDVTLKNQSSSSTAANRFICDGGIDLVIGANQGAQLRYDATTARWRVTLLQ